MTGTARAERAKPSALVRTAAGILAGYGGLLALAALDEGLALLVIGAFLIGGGAALWWGRRIGYVIGVVVAALFLAFVLLGVALDPDGVGLVIAAFALLPLALLLLPAARRPAPPEPVDAATTDRTPAPAGWTRELAGGRVKFVLLLVIFVVAILGAIAGLVAGEWRPGLTILAFGLAGLCTMPVMRSWRRSGRARRVAVQLDGRRHTGISFPYSQLRSRAVLFGAVLLGLTSLGMLLWARDFADSNAELWQARVIGLAGTVFFLGGGIFALVRTGGRGWQVVLLPDRVLVRYGPSRAAAPWASIVSIDADETTIFVPRGGQVREPFIRIRVDDPRSISGDGFDQAVRQLVPDSADEISVAVRALAVEPDLLYHALRYYHSHPQARDELGTASGLRRIRSEELDAGDSRRTTR